MLIKLLTKYRSQILLSLGFIVIIGFIPTMVKQHHISQLQNRIQELETNKDILSGNIAKLQFKHDECSTKQEERHNSANQYRTEIQVIEGQIDGVRYELGKIVGINEDDELDESLMQLICDKAPKSPLCGNNQLLEQVKQLPHYKTLIGISYAESHIGSNFAPHFGCKYSNNRGGLKRAKFDDGSGSKKYSEQYKTLNKELQGYLSGCYLYYFETPIDYFKSLSNTIEMGYAVCDGDPACINKSYVGHFSQDWIDNVNIFRNDYDKTCGVGYMLITDHFTGIQDCVKIH